MSDEKRVPETLETLAQRIAALPTKANLAELKSQLRNDIQAIRADVKRIYDVLTAQRDLER